MKPAGLPNKNYTYTYQDSLWSDYDEYDECCSCPQWMHLMTVPGFPCGDEENCGCLGKDPPVRWKNEVEQEQVELGPYFKDMWGSIKRTNLIWDINRMWGGHLALDIGFLNEPFPFYEKRDIIV